MFLSFLLKLSRLNVFRNQKVYDLLWALERVLEVDFIISNRNQGRYKIYRNLSLVVIKLLNATLARQQQLESEKYILIVPIMGESKQLDRDSDDDIPDLIDEIDR